LTIAGYLSIKRRLNKPVQPYLYGDDLGINNGGIAMMQDSNEYIHGYTYGKNDCL
jgi:hypothetical protein